jgi:hypothetical protein
MSDLEQRDGYVKDDDLVVFHVGGREIAEVPDGWIRVDANTIRKATAEDDDRDV